MTHWVNPAMLRLAREALGKTQTDIATATRIGQGSISKYEKGLQEPSDGQVEAICAVLGFPLEFFQQEERPAAVMYRTQVLRSAKTEALVRGRLNVVRLAVNNILSEISISDTVRFPDPDNIYDSPEAAAAALRRAWGVIPGPIESVSGLLELAGGVVVSADLGTDAVVAAYLHPMGDRFRWFIVNSRVSAGDRVRFSLAHELGHAVLHEAPALPESKEAEFESHRFAAAFLMPESDLRGELPRGRLQLSHLLELKLRFGVSMQTVLMSAHRMGAISEHQKAVLFRQISARGWRLREPGSVAIEKSYLLAEALRIHRQDHGYSDEELARAAKVPLAFLADLLPDYFAVSRPPLRLIGSRTSRPKEFGRASRD